MLKPVWDISALAMVVAIFMLVVLVAASVLAGVLLGGWLVHRSGSGRLFSAKAPKDQTVEPEEDVFAVPDVVRRMGPPFNPDPEWPWNQQPTDADTPPPSPVVKWQNERFREQLDTQLKQE